MADINEVFKPYDPDKPKVSFNLPSKEEVLAAILGLIPGGRAMYSEYKNPDISWKEYGDLVAEDVVPLYNTVIRPAATGDDIEWKEAAKEAALLGVPMPYIKHPKTGKPIPNNLKEGLGYYGWASAKSKWNHNLPNAKKLYTEEAITAPKSEGLSTRSRIDRTQIAIPGEEVVGPYRYTNTGSNIQNTGRQAMGTNTVPMTGRGGRRGYVAGANAWQGEMYPPGRRLRNDEMYGPYQWEDKYSRKLDAAIDENEYKWEYLINKTRPLPRTAAVPKQEIVDIALKQGRPDIAERVLLDDKPRTRIHDDPRMTSYNNVQSQYKATNEQWKDMGNRQVEKELRETFASLPNDPDIRYRFAEHYGVPDLYQSWVNDPLPWEKMKVQTKFNRNNREISNRSLDRRYGRNIRR